MKQVSFFLISFLCMFSAISQTPINGYLISSKPASNSNSYINGTKTYNWAISPDDSISVLRAFNANGLGYKYDSLLTGIIKLRRVNNVNTTGNFTLIWSESDSSGNTYNMFAGYQNNMEDFLNNDIYTQGAENLFDNISPNSNNIERMDWILGSAFSTSSPNKVGFAVLDRGTDNEHDPFCIAAITSVDVIGNPASYSNIIRVNTNDYADPLTDINYRTVKAQYPSDLIDASTGTESVGGVFISLQDLGVSPNTSFYGYSLFADDLPISATPGSLVDYTNPFYFPLNTGDAGGIDLLAITGIYTEISLLPIQFIDFNAVEMNSTVHLKWTVENETDVNKYEIERSIDGVNFLKIKEIYSNTNATGINTYDLSDDVSNISFNNFYYRIKQVNKDGNYYFSKIISIRLNNKNQLLSIYPNPVQKDLFINLQSKVSESTIVNITNSIGEKVLQKVFQLTNGNNSFTIDGINQLPNGVYNLSLQFSSGNKLNKQFIKE